MFIFSHISAIPTAEEKFHFRLGTTCSRMQKHSMTWCQPPCTCDLHVVLFEFGRIPYLRPIRLMKISFSLTAELHHTTINHTTNTKWADRMAVSTAETACCPQGQLREVCALCDLTTITRCAYSLSLVPASRLHVTSLFPDLLYWLCVAPIHFLSCGAVIIW